MTFSPKVIAHPHCPDADMDFIASRTGSIVVRRDDGMRFLCRVDAERVACKLARFLEQPISDHGYNHSDLDDLIGGDAALADLVSGWRSDEDPEIVQHGRCNPQHHEVACMNGTKPNIYQRVNAVRRSCKYIQKDKRVEGYKAVTHDAVTAEIRPYLIEHGIVVVPRQTLGESVNAGMTTKGGTPILRYDASYEIRFVNIDSPGDYIEITIKSQALDHGDKAPGKALSYATKYAILKLFSIETGEDEESREELRPRMITEDQRANIRALLDEVKPDEKKFLDWLRVGSVETILARDYDKAIDGLERKRSDG